MRSARQLWDSYVGLNSLSEFVYLPSSHQQLQLTLSPSGKFHRSWQCSPCFQLQMPLIQVVWCWLHNSVQNRVAGGLKLWIHLTLMSLKLAICKLSLKFEGRASAFATPAVWTWQTAPGFQRVKAYHPAPNHIGWEFEMTDSGTSTLYFAAKIVMLFY